MSVDGIDVGNKCVLPIKHGGSQFRPEFKITDITGYKLARDKAEKKITRKTSSRNSGSTNQSPS